MASLGRSSSRHHYHLGRKRQLNLNYPFTGRNRDGTNWIAGGVYRSAGSFGTGGGRSPCAATPWSIEDVAEPMDAIRNTDAPFIAKGDAHGDHIRYSFAM